MNGNLIVIMTSQLPNLINPNFILKIVNKVQTIKLREFFLIFLN